MSAMSSTARYHAKNQKGPRPTPNCPFGCRHTPEHSDLDDRFYCRHLIGFTLDGLTMELREKLDGGDGKLERVSGKVPVEEGDVVLETRSETKRVYRADGAAPYTEGTYKAKGKPVRPARTAVEALTTQNEELRTKAAQTDQLLQERARLVAERERLLAELEQARQAQPPAAEKGKK